MDWKDIKNLIKEELKEFSPTSKPLNEGPACYYNRLNWNGGYTCVRSGCGFNPSSPGSGWELENGTIKRYNENTCGTESVGG